MSRKSQVSNQNLREPLHRGGSADLDKEIDRLMKELSGKRGNA